MCYFLYFPYDIPALHRKLTRLLFSESESSLLSFFGYFHDSRFCVDSAGTELFSFLFSSPPLFSAFSHFPLSSAEAAYFPLLSLRHLSNISCTAFRLLYFDNEPLNVHLPCKNHRFSDHFPKNPIFSTHNWFFPIFQECSKFSLPIKSNLSELYIVDSNFRKILQFSIFNFSSFYPYARRKQPINFTRATIFINHHKSSWNFHGSRTFSGEILNFQWIFHFQEQIFVILEAICELVQFLFTMWLLRLLLVAVFQFIVAEGQVIHCLLPIFNSR